MDHKELNIKSSTIEMGLELAKDFLGKLISPTIEEVGLLISDNIKFFRFKNQVNILLKAQKYVEENNIKIKEIPIEILVPLLESASLECDETLQDKWANMIANMAGSSSNLQNQIFPYILGQISVEEFNELKEILIKEDDLTEKEIAISKLKGIEKRIKENEYANIKLEGFHLNLAQYERANLVRLGLVRLLPPRLYIEEFSSGGSELGQEKEWHQPGIEYDPDDCGYRITDLGEKFLELCGALPTIKTNV